MKVLNRTNRFIWQRFTKNIYPAKEIIFICNYNRNETETVLAGKLKQAVNGYYPLRFMTSICIFFDYIDYNTL